MSDFQSEKRNDGSDKKNKPNDDEANNQSVQSSTSIEQQNSRSSPNCNNGFSSNAEQKPQNRSDITTTDVNLGKNDSVKSADNLKMIRKDGESINIDTFMADIPHLGNKNNANFPDKEIQQTVQSDADYMMSKHHKKIKLTSNKNEQRLSSNNQLEPESEDLKLYDVLRQRESSPADIRSELEKDLQNNLKNRSNDLHTAQVDDNHSSNKQHNNRQIFMKTEPPAKNKNNQRIEPQIIMPTNKMVIGDINAETLNRFANELKAESTDAQPYEGESTMDNYQTEDEYIEEAKEPKWSILLRRPFILAICIAVIIILLLVIVNSILSPSDEAEVDSQSISLSASNQTDSSTAETSSSLIDSALPSPQNQAIEENTAISIQGSEVTSTEANISTNTTPNQRVEIPGDVVDSLNTNTSTPADTSTPVKTNTTAKKAHTASSSASAPSNIASLKSLSNNGLMIQLSASSQQEPLRKFAKEQNLSNYWIYNTTRNNQTWYVLVIGPYANKTAATKAIDNLPATVKANKPWIRTTRQVKSDIKK